MRAGAGAGDRPTEPGDGPPEGGGSWGQKQRERDREEPHSGDLLATGPPWARGPRGSHGTRRPLPLPGSLGFLSLRVDLSSWSVQTGHLAKQSS